MTKHAAAFLLLTPPKEGLKENRKHRSSVGLTWPNSESCSRAEDRFICTISRAHTAFPLSTKTFPTTSFANPKLPNPTSTRHC